MTREQLLNFICPMLETDECGKEDSCCETCNQYLNTLLDEYDNEIYNKALEDLQKYDVESIDDLVMGAYNKALDDVIRDIEIHRALCTLNDYIHCVEKGYDDAIKIAKQLKKGEKQ